MLKIVDVEKRHGCVRDNLDVGNVGVSCKRLQGEQCFDPLLDDILVWVRQSPVCSHCQLYQLGVERGPETIYV